MLCNDVFLTPDYSSLSRLLSKSLDWCRRSVPTGSYSSSFCRKGTSDRASHSNSYRSPTAKALSMAEGCDTD